MKTLITAVAAVLFSLTAFTQNASAFNDKIAITKTRTEVNADVMAAIARGERLDYGEAGPDPVQTSASTLTRAEVSADLMAAIARGERPRNGEARPDPGLVGTSTLTRAEIRAALMTAIARGELPRPGEASQYPLMSRRANAHRSLAMTVTDGAATAQ